MYVVEGYRNHKAKVGKGIASAAQVEQAEQGMGWCDMTSLLVGCCLLFGIEVV
jgi:hypothetical protein